ncbi:unnamed protein product [Allacma fusca]|uniref:PLAT domain-containing protein n=1 Tax=Allacma fusca TaxID=39272 RepID=A0A8J2JYV8_9HEXA|nr:unnamed protein product [Allacma fusca]
MCASSRVKPFISYMPEISAARGRTAAKIHKLSKKWRLLTIRAQKWVALNKGVRPTCSQVMGQWDTFLPTTSGSTYRLLDRFPRARSGHKMWNDSDDSYIVLWPESSLFGSERRVEVTLGVGFFELDCANLVGSQAIPNDNTTNHCFTTDKYSGRQLLNCKCMDIPLESLTEYLEPLEFRSEIYLPVVLMEDVRPCYIIPWIVLAFLILYIFLLIIVCVVDRRIAHAIRFVLMTDTQLIEEQYFYLLVVQTGNRPFAGTSANVCCQIHGSLSRSSSLVLGDGTLDLLKRRAHEANYIFSTPNDLGEVQMIRIWHDNSGPSPDWFLRKLIVKSMKTGRCWHFHVQRWLSISSSTLILNSYADPTTESSQMALTSPVYVLPYFLLQSSCTWSSSFAVYMIEWGDSRIFSSHVLFYAFSVSLVALFIAALLSYWYSSILVAKIPTLLVCGPKPRPIRPPPPRNPEVLRWRNLDPGREMVGADAKKEIVEVPEVSDSSLDFRIPSTSVSKTETWIVMHGTRRRRTYDPVERISPVRKLDNYKKILNDGVMGAVTSIKDENMQRLIYKPDFDESIDELIAEDIRDSFGKDLWAQEGPTNLKNITTMEISPSKKESKEAMVQTNLEDLETLTKGTEAVLNPNQTPRRNISVTLCQMLDSKKVCPNRGSCRILIWIICIVLIICSSIVTVVYGMRYGVTVTMDWIFSFIWTFIFSFLLSLTFQVFLYAVFSHLFTRSKQVANSLERKCRRRLQFLWFDKCYEDQIFPLRYLTYLCKCSHRPLTACAIFHLKADAERWVRQRNNLINILISLLFVLALVILFTSVRLSQLYYCKRSDENLFKLSGQFDPRAQTLQSHHPSLKSVRDSLSLHAFLRDAVEKSARSLIVSPQAKEKKAHELSGQRSEYLPWLPNNMSVLLGSIRLRQQRLVQGTIQKSINLKYNIANEQGEWQINKSKEAETLQMNTKGLFKDTWFRSTKDTGKFGEGWSVASRNDSRRRTKNKSQGWEWLPDSRTGSGLYSGSFGSYDGGGFIRYVHGNETGSPAVFDQIEASGWLDDRTSVLFVELATYNPYLGVFNILQLINERSPFHSWEISKITRTHKYMLNLTDLTWTQLLLISVLLICLVYFMVSAVVGIINTLCDPRKYGRFWILFPLWVDLAIVLWGVFTFIVFCAALHTSAKQFSPPENLQRAIVSFQALGLLYFIVLYSTVFLLLLGIFKLWILLAPNYGRWCVAWMALTLVSNQILHFFLYFLVLLVAFASFCHLAFGSFDWQYKTLWQSILTLIQFSNVEVSFRTTELYSRVLGPVFYLAYYIFMYFLSIFLIFSVLRLSFQEIHYQRSLRLSHRKEPLATDGTIPQKRLNMMTAVVRDTLWRNLNSPIHKRVRSAKALAMKLVNTSAQRITSKSIKWTTWSKTKLTKISTSRYEVMEILMVKYVKASIGHEFQLDSQRDYNNYNAGLTRLKYEKLQQSLIKLEVEWNKTSSLK